MKPFWKTLTFWISAVTWLGLVGGHYAGLTPPPWGLVMANIVAMIYATLRCLQKRNSGLPWKSIFLTSEFAVTVCTVLVNFLESLTQLPVMSSRALAVISAAISGLVWLLHTLNGTTKPGQFGVPFVPAAQVITKSEKISEKLPDTHLNTTKE
jgi:hypothetical protein